MAQPETHSRLFYHGTTTEVCIGDHVRIRRWFRRDLEGVVCYIPGISPRRAELEDAEEQYFTWAIQVPDGIVLTMAYSPEIGQPPRKIAFVRRSDRPSLDPTTELK